MRTGSETMREAIIGQGGAAGRQYIHCLGARLHLTLPHLRVVALPGSSVALLASDPPATPRSCGQGGLRGSPHGACLSSREAAQEGVQVTH
jgi:hypothetical protein